MANLIYISPSNQDENIGAGAYGTEKYRMEAQAMNLQGYFTYTGVNSVVATLTKSIVERIAESKAKGATIYLPVHSNAGGGRGPETLYLSSSAQSKSLATKIQTELFNLYARSFPNSINRGIKDGSAYKELNSISPAVGAYIEVAFHDNLDDANWIINNIALITVAIVTGVRNFNGRIE